MDAEGNLIEEQAASGNLVITASWPGQIGQSTVIISE